MVLIVQRRWQPVRLFRREYANTYVVPEDRIRGADAQRPPLRDGQPDASGGVFRSARDGHRCTTPCSAARGPLWRPVVR
jgi:hypothetical protein